MKSITLQTGLKQIALVGLLAVVAVAMSGCMAMAKANSGGRSAGLVDSELVSQHPPNANTLYGMARLLRSQGKHEQAEFVLLSLQRDYPTFSPTYNDLAEIRMSQNRFEEAIEYLDKGIAVAPNDAVLLNNAGVCCLLKHDFESALVYFKRASAIAPYQERYRANVALAMGLNGELEASRTLYGQIVSAEDAEFNAALIHELAGPEPVEQAAAKLPDELSYQEAELETTETVRAADTEEMEMTFARPVPKAPEPVLEAPEPVFEAPEPAVVESAASESIAEALETDGETLHAKTVEPVIEPALDAPEPAIESAASESIAEALETDAETLHAETVEPVVEPAEPVKSFTNSDVEAHEAETALLEASSEIQESVQPEEPTTAVGFEVEAVETGASEIEKSLETTHPGDDAAKHGVEATAAELVTTVEAKAYFAASKETHVAFAIEAGEPAAGDASAFVFEAVEPEEIQIAPGPSVQEREWVEGEYLLRETTPEEHFVPSDSATAEVPASMLEEFVAAEATAIEDSPTGDFTALEVAEIDVLEQLDEEPTDDFIETNRVDESTD